MNTFVVATALVLIILLIVVLLGPFRLYINLEKDDIYLKSLYKISFLGITLKKGEISSIQKGVTDETTENQEAVSSKLIETSENDDRKQNKTPPLNHVRLLVDAFPKIAQILIDIIKSINVSKFVCKVSFGLDDPVDTAVVNGYLWSIVYATGLYKTNIRIDPRFDGPQLQGSFSVVIEARLLWFVVAAAKALEEEKTRKLIFKLVKGEFP